jgi:hypothetical protein
MEDWVKFLFPILLPFPIPLKMYSLFFKRAEQVYIKFGVL